MGFPSPATDYIEGRLNLNELCGVRPSTRLFERDGCIYIVDCALKPGAREEFLFELYGECALGKMVGGVLITADGETIEGPELQDLITLGVATFTIIPHHGDSKPVI